MNDILDEVVVMPSKTWCNHLSEIPETALKYECHVCGSPGAVADVGGNWANKPICGNCLPKFQAECNPECFRLAYMTPPTETMKEIVPDAEDQQRIREHLERTSKK